ncbi:AMP-binding enzyme family protein, partial [Vibrio parahaemolyticus EKP-021]
KATLLLAI